MTPEQWAAILGAFTGLHHPEVVWVGIPGVALLIYISLQLRRIAEALEK